MARCEGLAFGPHLRILGNMVSQYFALKGLLVFFLPRNNQNKDILGARAFEVLHNIGGEKWSGRKIKIRYESLALNPPTAS